MALPARLAKGRRGEAIKARRRFSWASSQVHENKREFPRFAFYSRRSVSSLTRPVTPSRTRTDCHTAN
jgi:hypothetical protein